MSAEATVSRTYLDWMTNLPWYKEVDENSDLSTQERLLMPRSWLEDVKERILEYLAVLRLPQKVARRFVFGRTTRIGKTSLAKSIAAATGRPYVRQALGGARWVWDRGHRRTYIGSLPGKIFRPSSEPALWIRICWMRLIKWVVISVMRSAAALLCSWPEQNDSFRDHYWHGLWFK